MIYNLIFTLKDVFVSPPVLTVDLKHLECQIFDQYNTINLWNTYVVFKNAYDGVKCV